MSDFNASERLAQFEEILAEVERLYEESSNRLEELKAQGKTKGTAVQQAIAAKMTYQNMLIMYKRFELIEEL